MELHKLSLGADLRDHPATITTYDHLSTTTSVDSNPIFRPASELNADFWFFFFYYINSIILDIPEQ